MYAWAFLQILEPEKLVADPAAQKNEKLYPPGRPSRPPARSTHDAGHDAPWKRIVVAVHLIISAAYSAVAHMATSMARGGLLYDIRDVDIGERRGMQLGAFVRPQVELPSCGAQHAHETRKLAGAFPQHFQDAHGVRKRILFLNIDRGPDENMCYFESVYSNVLMFLRMGLGLLVVASRAAGHSSANWHEQAQSYIRKATEAAMYSCTYFGSPRFKSKKGHGAPEPATEDDRFLMLRNLNHECVNIVQSIAAQSAYENPIAAYVSKHHDPDLGSAALSAHRAARNTAAVDVAEACDTERNSRSKGKVPGCSCKPHGTRAGGACRTHACRSCTKQGRPCTLFCDCAGRCANPHNEFVLPGRKSLVELNSMALEEIVRLLNPTDLELFSVRHCIRTKYCLQVSRPCVDTSCVSRPHDVRCMCRSSCATIRSVGTVPACGPMYRSKGLASSRTTASRTETTGGSRCTSVTP